MDLILYRRNGEEDQIPPADVLITVAVENAARMNHDVVTMQRAQLDEYVYTLLLRRAGSQLHELRSLPATI